MGYIPPEPPKIGELYGVALLKPLIVRDGIAHDPDWDCEYCGTTRQIGDWRCQSCGAPFRRRKTPDKPKPPELRTFVG